MSQDYHPRTIARFHKEFPNLAQAEDGSFLDATPEQKIGDTAVELTNPYGALEYCIGNGEDFYCFDFAIVTGKRGTSDPYGETLFVLDSAINSETGGFIQGGSVTNLLCKPHEAIRWAAEMVADAMDWMACNDIRHNRKGWNQTPGYFFRSVFLNAVGDIPSITERDRVHLLENAVSERALRFNTSKRLQRIIRAANKIYALP